MKPATLPIPPTDAARTETSRLEVQRVRDRALDEEYFRRELAAGRVAYEGTVTEPLNGNVVCMRFAAGAEAHAQKTVLLRDLWPRTRPRLTLWYTSPVGSTATFTVRFRIRPFPAGGTTTSSGIFVDFTPAGPAVANTVMTATVVIAGAMPSVQAPMLLRVGRLAGDANANDLDILLAVITLEEVA